MKDMGGKGPKGGPTAIERLCKQSLLGSVEKAHNPVHVCIRRHIFGAAALEHPAPAPWHALTYTT